MRTVSQREMRNQSGELLRSVQGGESVIVTNRGRPVAVISPYIDNLSPIERLREQGLTRAPQTSREALREIEPVTIDTTSANLLREARGDA